jgi:putative ABC transport system permease protein
MTATRWRKVVADLAKRRVRTLLTLFGLSLGLIFVGSVLTTFSILRNDLDANFRATNPPNIVLGASRIPASLKDRLAALPGVLEVEERPEFGALMQTAPDRWLPLRVSVVSDFQRMRVATLRTDPASPSLGSRSPSPPGIFIERDGRWFFPTTPTGSLPLRLPNGATVSASFSGYVFDAGQHPSRMERVLYGYITPQTLAAWPYAPAGTRLLMITTPAAAHSVGTEIETLFKDASDKDPAIALQRLEIHTVAQHGHQFQFDTLLTLLAALAVIALAMCAILTINLIDSLMAVEQRTLAVLRAIGARSSQIILDYSLGMAALGLTAGLLSLYPSLWFGRTIARFVAMGVNFNLLSPSGPWWMLPALLCVATLIPVVVASWAICRAARQPLWQGLARGRSGRTVALAHGFPGVTAFLPSIPRLAVRSIARRPRKVLLSALILSMGLTFFCAALTLRASMLSTVESVRRTLHFDVVVLLRSTEPINELAAWTDEIPGVRRLEWWSVAEGTLYQRGLRVGNPVSVIGVPDDTLSLHLDLRSGRWLDPHQPAGIVVNQALIRAIPSLRAGMPYQLQVAGRSVDTVIVGIVQEFNPAQIYCRKALLEQGADPHDRANAIVMTLNDSSLEAQDRAAKLIQASATRPARQFSAILRTRVMEAVILGHLNILSGLLLVIAVISLGVGALGLASAIGISVVERYREIAVLKAIGGRGSMIAALFATEALGIGLIGWALSVGFAAAISRPIVDILGSAVIGYEFTYRPSVPGLLLALVVAITVAFLAALAPIRSAMHLTIRAGLRSE